MRRGPVLLPARLCGVGGGEWRGRVEGRKEAVGGSIDSLGADGIRRWAQQVEAGGGCNG